MFVLGVMPLCGNITIIMFAFHQCMIIFFLLIDERNVIFSQWLEMEQYLLQISLFLFDLNFPMS